MSDLLNDDYQVQTEQIMLELRLAIEKYRQVGALYELPPELEDLLRDQVPGALLPDYLQKMLEYWEISPGDAVSHRRLVSGWVFAGVKKLVRLLLGWYIEPGLARQRMFNLAMLRCLTELVTTLRAKEVDKPDAG